MSGQPLGPTTHTPEGAVRRRRLVIDRYCDEISKLRKNSSVAN